MREGSLEAPVRHPIDWRDPDFIDPQKIDEELRRVFDVCHGCRRCFNLCDSFPRLFDLIDESNTMELDSVDSKDFKSVIDACTLCDMCFMTKSPYVPPHEFDLDFPHLMLRVHTAERANGKKSFVEDQLSETDRNGKLARPIAGLANWATKRSNNLTRSVLEIVAKIHKEAELPKYQNKPLEQLANATEPSISSSAPAYGRKAVLYATCYGNFNKTEIGLATNAVLAINGVETHVLHPVCCGMPKLEKGNLDGVQANAKAVTAALKPWIEKDFDIIALMPSCALMLKFEWPLIMPHDADIKRLAAATFDISEYIIDISKKEGLADGLKPLSGGINMHLACHARAQNMGPKAVDLLKLIPDADIHPIERCSGHGGSWGVMKENFDTALKVGKPVARTASKSGKQFIASECPLAADHILQGMERIEGATVPDRTYHPVELFAMAYGIDGV